MIFDPPSDPEGGDPVCRYCDRRLERERFTRELVCVNPCCEHSPRYDEMPGEYGSNNGMAASLQDAGFGSLGPM